MEDNLYIKEEGNNRNNAFKRLLKRQGNEIFTVLLIVLVGVGGFGLGRLSALEQEKGEVKILSASVSNSDNNSKAVAGESEDVIIVPTLEEGGKVVASKTGTKYHLPWCSGAKTIKEENKIWFDSYQEARAAGYLPAGNCKGIE